MVVDVTSWGVPAIPSRPSGFRSNTQGLILSTFEDQPAITNWVNGEPVNQMFPDARTVEDITPTDPTYGTHFVGYTPAWGTAIWHYSPGNFTQQLIEGFFPWYPASTKVTSRRISNSIVIPMGDGIWRNGRTQRIPALLGDPPAEYKDWNIFQVSPNKNFLLATATKVSNQSQRAILMVPADIAVDANRDGVIRYGGSTADTAGVAVDKTSKQKPFRFWVNDDGDGLPNSEGEVVGSASKDYEDGVIQTARDLEDFSRLQMFVGAFHGEIAAGTMKVGLKWRDTNGTSPKIKVYKSTDTTGTDSYLKSETAAFAQVSGPDAETLGEVSTSAPLVLPASAWTGFSPSNAMKALLFEGSGEGKGQLCITIHKSDGTLIGEGPGVWMDLNDIRKMYQSSEGDLFAGAPPGEAEHTLVFVHGWNMSPEGSRSFAETMFKRLWHRGFKGRFAYFRWNTDWSSSWQWLPAGGGVIDAYLAEYNNSEYRAWTEAAPALQTFVGSLPYATKNIAAHSMGNIVTSEASRLGMQVDNYALMQAAVPAAAYDQRDEVRQQNPGTHFGVFPLWNNYSPDDDPDWETRKLAYRGRFAEVSGNLISFCLEADFATSVAWEINNSAKKPPSDFVLTYVYNRQANSGEKLRKLSVFPPVLEYYVTDRNEAMSYACKTWGKAAGAWLPTAGTITASTTVNLGTATYQLPGEAQNSGFGDEHSGQFNANIQSLKPFYDTLINRLQIGPPNP